MGSDFEGKKRIYHLSKDGQVICEDYKDIARLYREKIRKARIEFIFYEM